MSRQQKSNNFMQPKVIILWSRISSRITFIKKMPIPGKRRDNAPPIVKSLTSNKLVAETTKSETSCQMTKGKAAEYQKDTELN